MVTGSANHQPVGFASVHAVPIRAAGIVLGALGLFGIHPGELNGADLLVGQTLARIACVAILQEGASHAPTATPHRGRPSIDDRAGSPLLPRTEFDDDAVAFDAHAELCGWSAS
jgi:hypothetical protein